jgi:hypothetical protein
MMGLYFGFVLLAILAIFGFVGSALSARISQRKTVVS